MKRWRITSGWAGHPSSLVLAVALRPQPLDGDRVEGQQSPAALGLGVVAVLGVSAVRGSVRSCPAAVRSGASVVRVDMPHSGPRDGQVTGLQRSEALRRHDGEDDHGRRQNWSLAARLRGD